jgi:toxin ParE1/3/4
MRAYRVHLIEDVEQDLIDIYTYVAASESAERANGVLDRLESLCRSLSRLAMRGHSPPELKRIGVTGYRELHYKPYRVIYEIRGPDVYVHCALDGRRDLQSLLERRLLR